MLDMGFIHDIRKVISAVPQQRQTLFFSATMPTNIRNLAFSILRDHVKVEVAPESSVVETVDQKVFFVEKTDKRKLLMYLLENDRMNSVLVFSRTKHGADRLARELSKKGYHATLYTATRARMRGRGRWTILRRTATGCL